MLKRLNKIGKCFAALIVALVALFVPAFGQKNLAGEMTFEQFVTGIAERSSGLNFISETDSEVVVWYRTRPVESLSVAEFKRVARIAPLSEVETRTFDEFFTRLIEYDPTGFEWARLRYFIEENTTEQIVFRVRRAAPYDNYFDIYAVGLFDGKVIGIHVVSLET
jgi:hypothetical protein